MGKIKRDDKEPKRRLNFFDLMMEIFGWIQIVASPLLIGLIVGFIIYVSKVTAHVKIDLFKKIPAISDSTIHNLNTRLLGIK